MSVSFCCVWPADDESGRCALLGPWPAVSKVGEGGRDRPAGVKETEVAGHTGQNAAPCQNKRAAPKERGGGGRSLWRISVSTIGTDAYVHHAF